MSLLNRIDPSSWRIEFPEKLKRHNYSKGVGLCNDRAVGNVSATHKEKGVWWPESMPELLTLEGKRELSVSSARGREIFGKWSGGDKEGVVLWCLGEDLKLTGIDLHPPGYAKSYAHAVCNGVQVGTASPKPKKGEYASWCGALWRGTNEVTLLNSPDWKESSALGTDGEFQVGYVEGNRQHRAAIWQGTAKSLLLLGKEGMASEAHSVRDGEQVGLFFKKNANRAALWKGSADSLLDLTPEGFEASGAYDCAKGLQVGYVKKRELTPAGSSNMETRAALWGGTTEFFDLQSLLPEKWNGSIARFIEVAGDNLTIVGTAESILSIRPGVDAPQALGESCAVVWRGKLRG